MMKLVAFTAGWCGPCRNLKPHLDEVSYELPLEEYDVDCNSDLVSEFGVTSVPTVVVLDANDDEVERIVGITPKQLEELARKHT